MTPVANTWGTTPDERRVDYPCDEWGDDFGEACYRGVTIRAPASTVFRWLCQLRVAPYSYDWIDNRGRQSPPRLTPGLEDLAPGQRFMTVFELVAFEAERHVTLRLRRDRHRSPAAERMTLLPIASRGFPDVAVSYLIHDPEPDRCRLLVKLLIRYPAGFAGWIQRRLLPSLDLIMMRRQLLNLKALAEKHPTPPAGRGST